MSTALWGAGLVLAASLWGLWSYYARQKQRRALVWAFAAALGEMESGIRWLQTPLPVLLEGLSGREDCGVWFRKVTEQLQGDVPLQVAWNSVFSVLEDTENGEILRRVTLSGDRERVTGELRRAREELEALYRRRCGEDGQRMRVTAAAALCGTGFVIILLI